MPPRYSCRQLQAWFLKVFIAFLLLHALIKKVTAEVDKSAKLTDFPNNMLCARHVYKKVGDSNEVTGQMVNDLEKWLLMRLSVKYNSARTQFDRHLVAVIYPIK